MNRLYFKGSAGCELCTQLCHINVYRSGTRLRIHIPKLIHQLSARKGLFGIRQELVEKIEFSCCERDLFSVERGTSFVRIHYKAADLQAATRRDFGATEKRTDTQEKLIKVDGLGHIIVNTNSVASLLGCKVVTRGHKENGNIVVEWELEELAEMKGHQELYTKQSPQRLQKLREFSMIESAVSSNRIEGVSIDDKRIGTVIFGNDTNLRDRNEEEVRGYRSVETEIPVIFGVLTTDNIEQAIERAGTKAGNKGYDVACTAIEMVNLMKNM